MTPNLAQLTLEHFRCGPRWQSRLAMLAEHFARQYGADPEQVYRDALALTFDGERPLRLGSAPDRQTETLAETEGSLT